MSRFLRYITCSLACCALSMIFACTQPYIERNLTDEEKLQMKDLDLQQMMAPPQEQKIIECRKKLLSKQKDDKPYHLDDFLYDAIVPEEEICEEVNPANVKSSIQRDEERLIDTTIDRQLKEALDNIDKKE